MAKKSPSTATLQRKPRLLWANPFCLLDTSSGASMSVRQMLHQLMSQGYEVQVLGATVFDNPKGMGLLKEQYPNLNNHLHQHIEVKDGSLAHQLVVTQRPERLHMTAHEEGLWYGQYVYLLDSFKPDIVWFYGGQTLDLLIADEARMRDIPAAAYLVNSNYKAARWCRDVNLIVTDTYATSDMYRKTVGFVPRPVGKFIESDQFVASQHERKRLLFVNPSWPKGASVFVQLAEKLDRERPDITLEVVEARADWSAVLRETTKRMGQQRESLSNVHVTPNTSDMRPPYSRARVLIAPSLWWESGARVLAEAMLNGIPAIVSDSGGNREMVKEGGWVVDLPDACFEKPYQHLLSDEELQPLFNAVVALFDDEALYQEFVKRASTVGQELHHIQVSTRRLLDAFSPLTNQRSGNKDFHKPQRRTHKHKLASTAGKPGFKAMPIPASVAKRTTHDMMSVNASQPAAIDFDWQLKSKIIILDNRAKLMKNGLANRLVTTDAFGIVAFDPASQVTEPEKYAENENIQVFQHALLGDGHQATLYACVAPELTSTLRPLPDDHLPEHRRFGTKVITKLPINTIALDSIQGLDNLDWLILDEFSDAVTILAQGKKILKNTLLIQARVAFQPTHENQPSLAELQHWASRNGFRFYRLNDMSHHSLFEKPEDGIPAQASQLESADAIFLPSNERLEKMAENQISKLAFLLHTVFCAQDAAYRALRNVSHSMSDAYSHSLKEGDNNHKDLKRKASRHKLTPDELVEKSLPDEELKQPGSIRWLIEKERQFGGLQRDVVRNKISKLDPRKPHQYSAGFVKNGNDFLPTHIGGDRMSMNFHGYSIAYSKYLRPLIEKKLTQELTIVEVGILRGTGLAIWCDLFPDSRVIGLDLDPSIFEQHRPVLEELGAFQKNQPEIYSFDQFADNREKIRKILSGDRIDVFIDDGAHTYEAIMKTLDAAKPFLSEDFVYFVEDFKGIEKPIKKSLNKAEVDYADEMTVAYSRRLNTKKGLKTKKEFIESDISPLFS